MDKNFEFLNDVKEDGFSSCCGASVYLDICADCKEHCDVEYEDDGTWLPGEAINEITEKN